MKANKKKDEILDRLVENGLDFLHKAIDEIKEHQKFSIIHFYAAVELFLKARLMEEHWSLVISDRHNLDWNKFISGDFLSVSLDGAADRLEKVVGSKLFPAELKTFRAIAQHRNKAVHFFHEAHSDEDNNKQIERVIIQQLNAWYYLHHLLTDRWNTEFGKWSSHIKKVDEKFRSLRSYLRVVYDQKKPEIKKREQNGDLFQKCPSCFYEAQYHQSEEKNVYQATCLVCELSRKCLRIECPTCGEIVTFVDGGFGKCEKCKTPFEPEDIVEEFTNYVAANLAVINGDDSLKLGNCSECESHQTVVRMRNDKYFCTCCFLEFDSLQRCDWCGQPNTGDMSDSMWSGCSHCDGRKGWLKYD